MYFDLEQYFHAVDLATTGPRLIPVNIPLLQTRNSWVCKTLPPGTKTADLPIPTLVRGMNNCEGS